MSACICCGQPTERTQRLHSGGSVPYCAGCCRDNDDGSGDTWLAGYEARRAVPAVAVPVSHARYCYRYLDAAGEEHEGSGQAPTDEWARDDARSHVAELGGDLLELWWPDARDPDDDAACRADHEYDQRRDDALMFGDE